ncbi:MAG: diguanylate cyclase, partial [Acidobacteriota bacterium]|nr:diguanylate cyclase [Acidobacteriota bacterium]
MREKATYKMDKEKELENLDDFVELSAFVDVEVGISAVKTINEAMNRVMEKIGKIFAPVNWALLLIDKKTEKLYFKLVVGKNASKLKNKRIPKEENITNKVVKTGQPILIEDVQKDPKLSSRIDKITGFKAKSIIGAPLKVNDKIIGVIQLINNKNMKPFSPAEVKVLTTIADYAAAAIENVYYLSSLKNLANIDSLTGVYNKSNFDKQLNKEIERYKRYSHGLSIIIIDIDDFKKINDQHGNSVGDNILKDLARILKKNIRTVDIV